MLAWSDPKQTSPCPRQSGLTDGYPFALTIRLFISVWTRIYLFFTVVSFVSVGCFLCWTCWRRHSLRAYLLITDLAEQDYLMFRRMRWWELHPRLRPDCCAQCDLYCIRLRKNLVVARENLGLGACLGSLRLPLLWLTE